MRQLFGLAKGGFLMPSVNVFISIYLQHRCFLLKNKGLLGHDYGKKNAAFPCFYYYLLLN